MHPRRFALIAGIVMLALGVLSFIPNLSSALPGELPALRVESSYGLFLGLFAFNIFNKLALVFFGIGGLMAYFAKDRNLPASICHAKWVFWVMGPLAILGAIPQTNTLGDYWPLFGYDILLHGLFAVLGAYYGYVLPKKAHEALMSSPAIPQN